MLEEHEQIIGLHLDYDRFVPSDELSEIINQQRMKSEEEGEHKKHSRHTKTEKKNYRYGDLNLPLNAGRCIFNVDLQQKMMNDSGVFFVNEWEYEDYFPEDKEMDNHLRHHSKIRWTLNPPLEN